MIYTLSYTGRTVPVVKRRSLSLATVNRAASNVIAQGAANVRIEYGQDVEGIILAAHFMPGNIILSDYWRDTDLVIAFHPSTPSRGWSVDVIRCDTDGNPVAGERVRNHCTHPDTQDRVIRRAA